MGFRTMRHDEALDEVWEELVHDEARRLGDPLTPERSHSAGAPVSV